jgi:phosphoribosyl 1,2-cyclic phosphodiesterase
LRVTVLGSGSNGNATLVEAGGSRILVDAGFSGRDLERRLESVEVRPDSIEGIVITHEHIDHVRGMGVLARRFRIPLYLTPVTRRACAQLLTGTEELREYRSQQPFRIGPLEVNPFLTTHDAADPVAVTIRDLRLGHQLGIATDLGRPTAAVRSALQHSHLLVLEANHDDAMLWNGPYPWSVKQRIASSHGHLSNRAAGHLVGELHGSHLGGVILAHLSEHCNDAQLAHDVVGAVLAARRFNGLLEVAEQDRPLDPIDLADLVRWTEPEQLRLF